MSALRTLAAQVATGLGVLALLAGAASTVARSAPASWVPVVEPDTWAMLTAFSDFGILAYAAAAVLTGAALLLRLKPHRVAVAVVVGLLAALHGSWILPWFVPDLDRPAKTAPAVRVLTLNLQTGEADPREIVAATRSADVVVLVEITEPALRSLHSAGFGRRFGHSSNRPLPQIGAEGTAVFSRYPISAVSPFGAGSERQSWLVTVDTPGVGTIKLAAVHPLRPHRGHSEWAPDQAQLRRSVLRTEPDLVAGDFNAVASHPTMRQLRADGYRSSTDSAGAGWQPTWPADRNRLPPLVGIDHVLLGPGLTATTSETFKISGTDHLGVIATITRPR